MANEYFGKVTKKGIQIIPVIITDAAIGAIATLVGVQLSSAWQAITRGFLVKKVKIALGVTGLATNESVIIGINANDGGIAGGYAAGLIASLLDPEATEAYLTTQELVKTNWHETGTLLHNIASGAGNLQIDKMISIGGGKGIPCPAGAGPEVHAFNPTGDTLTTGGLVNGIVTFYGVWLED